MRRAWTIAIVLVGGLVLFLALRSQSDPTYNGSTISQWIDRAAPGGGPWIPGGERELDLAVSHLGARAIPVLVRKIGDERWLKQDKLFALQRHLPLSLQYSRLFQTLQRRVADDEMRAQARSFAAGRALASLGTNALPALPGLMRLFRGQNAVSFPGAYAAGEVLVRLGQPAFLEILKCLADPKFANPLFAVQLIGRMHRMQRLGDEGAAAVPLLCERLRPGNSALAVACADTLGELRAGPVLAVPALNEALTNALQSGDVSLSRKSAEALGQFGLSASNSVPVLCAALNSSDGITTEEAARALGRIRTGQDLAVPALLDYLRRNGSHHRRFAIEGLSGYRAAGPMVVGQLRAALQDEDHDTRAIAKQALERVTVSEPLPVQPR